MSRTMTAANARLFQRLSEFCRSRGEIVAPSTGFRFLEGDDENDLLIKHLKLARTVQFGFHRAVIHATFENEDFILLAGFDHLDEYVNRYPEFGEDVVEADFLPGHAVVILSELDVRPMRSGREARSYIEVADSTVESYEGHNFDELRRLFPRFSVFKCRFSINEGSFYQLVAKFAVAESAYGGGWIGEALLSDLLAIASISANSFPYEAISRAVFDTDPRNLYLALYRCLEATYAYKTSEELAKALGLSIAWSELAVKLDQNLSWRPREASSLQVVLRHASDADLRKMVASLGNEAGEDLARSAASSIYNLRNRIVHFGAALDSVDITSYDWNAVCSALVGVVYDVFHRAFDPAAV